MTTPLATQRQKELDANFRTAVERGDLHAIDKALAGGADINAAMGKDGSNALFYAVDRGSRGLAEALLERGIETKTSGFNNNTPLMRAVIRRDAPMVELLLEYGSDPQWPPSGVAEDLPLGKTGPGLHPLHQACIYGLEDIVALFIRHGADLESCARNGGSPVWYAAANGHKGVVCQLLNAGANAEGRFENWMVRSSYHPRMGPKPAGQKREMYLDHKTSLFHPASSNKDEMVALLLDAGADPQATDDKGQTAREYARQWKRDNLKTDAVFERYAQYPAFVPEKLGELRKADVFAPNEHGYCLLDSPSTWRHFAAVAEHLTQQGEPLSASELEATNKDGKSWLQRGVECFATAQVFGYYSRQAGEFPVRQLLTADRKASPLLDALCARKQVGGLFTQEIWKNSSREDLKSVFHALPPEMQSDVRNYHQLLASLPHASEKSRGR